MLFATKNDKQKYVGMLVNKTFVTRQIYQKNIRVLESIVEAVVFCGKQSAPLLEPQGRSLKSIVEAVVFCGKQSAPLLEPQGRSFEYIISWNKGNFLEILELSYLNIVKMSREEEHLRWQCMGTA